MGQKKYEGRSVAVVAATSVQGDTGGAERLYDALYSALRDEGCRVDLISCPTDESSFKCILENYRHCENLDVSSYDVVISTKAPTFMVRHPRHVAYLMHTIRVFYDMFDKTFPSGGSELIEQRNRVHQLDSVSLGNAKHRFAISYEVLSRLRKWNRLDAEILHPALSVNGMRREEPGNYFFLPGRLHRWKRVDLAIRAIQLSSLPLRLLIAGSGEANAELRQLAHGDPRIEFLGHVSDEELIDLYANSLGVVFVPVKEDFGFVTLEAFASGKPVITCRDSGEPLEFVAHGQTGLIAEATAEGLKDAMERLFRNRKLAEQMGRAGHESTRQISWPNVARRLLDAGFAEPTPDSLEVATTGRKKKVVVLDMQPIDPPVGGGRLRLLGLYHALGHGIETRYIGTYDWPGEKFRQHQLSAQLEEIDIPLSSEHHEQARDLKQLTDGKVVIDVAFPRLGHLSPDYVRSVREGVDGSDVVIFSHPWVFPLVAERLRLSQLVVYDSQNVEGFLRAQLLGTEGSVERSLLREVVAAEYQLGLRADLILACSAEDRQRFARIYEWPFAKMRVMPNGVMSRSIAVATADERILAKQSVGLGADALVALFIGSAYAPNNEAASFISRELAPSMPDICFVIAGGVGSSMNGRVPKNVRITGLINDEMRKLWLKSADIGINPMFSGSGTNIKMFDMMAAGLPVVTTPAGARGIGTAGRRPFIIAEPSRDGFIAALRDLVANRIKLQPLSKSARECVDDGYSWEKISPHLGSMLITRINNKQAPLFSVVIPTFERHGQLNELMKCLERQTERDFEVIVVDQSSRDWDGRTIKRSFQMTYIYTDVRGAARARNTGADCARGSILAFTDDDCLPLVAWLGGARKHFEKEDVIGLEGAIKSDHPNDPAYRPVTNLGFEGMGFMTANLFVRSEMFHRLNGFDLDFDCPSFREDTDFGWRLLDCGKVPYAADVTVFHPAQSRSFERESHSARAEHFQKDALLLAKHPSRYRLLFEKEGHWRKTPGFWDNFEKGAKKYSVNISDYLRFK